MVDLKVRKLNEVMLEIDCDQGQAYSLRDYFAKFTPNYKYAPLFKMGAWDGKVKYFDMNNHTLPVGLLPMLNEYVNNYNLTCEFDIEKKDFIDNSITDELLHNFYKEIFVDSKFYPRDHQHESIKNMLINRRAVIENCTSSGKSMIIYCLARYMLKMGLKFIIIVPSISLTRQMFSDMQEYGWVDGPQLISILQSQDRNLYNSDAPILISTWQSLYKKPVDFFDKYEGFIVDETHILSSEAKAVTTLLKKLTKSHYRFGCTGTLPTHQTDLMNIYGYIGSLVYSVATSDMIDAGVLSDITVANIILRHPKGILNSLGKDYAAEVRYTESSTKRKGVFRWIINNIKDDDNILILCTKVNQVKSIAEDVAKHFPNRDVKIIYGAVNSDTREVIRKGMNAVGGQVLIATYGTFAVGVSVNRLHHVVFASSYKSKIKVLQSIGRGLRVHESKEKVIIWDIVDDMSLEVDGKIHTNYLYKHWLERKRYYKANKFKMINKEFRL